MKEKKFNLALERDEIADLVFILVNAILCFDEAKKRKNKKLSSFDKTEENASSILLKACVCLSHDDVKLGSDLAKELLQFGYVCKGVVNDINRKNL